MIKELNPVRLIRVIAILAAVLLGFDQLNSFAANKVIMNLPATASGMEIQKALDDLPPGGEAVLGSGEYEIHQPLMLQHDDVTLRGAGLSTVLRLADNANCPVVLLAPPLSETKRAVTHLHLADLVIDGNRQHQNTEFWRSAGDGSEINNNGVQIWNATDALVERVVCFDCRSGGLVTALTRHLVLRDFDSYGNQFDGLACYQTEECQLDGLKLHDNLGAGISLDLAFNHNSISNAEMANNDLGIFMRDSRDNVFHGLNIAKSHNAGVFMAQADRPTEKGWALAPGTECTGNSFQDLTVHDCGGRAFLVNDLSCTNNPVSGANFLRNAMDAVAERPAKPAAASPISLGTVGIR